MRVLLLEPKRNCPDDLVQKKVVECPSQALLILASIAKQAGHEVVIAYAGHRDPPMNDFDIVGITCNTFQVKNAKELAGRYQVLGSKVVIGGPHAEYYDGPCDGKIVGPGEKKWAALMDADGWDGNIDWTLADLHQFSGVFPIGAWPSVAVMTARGCPFKCTFCNTPKFWGSRVELMPPTEVLWVLCQLRARGAKEVFFQDDTFNVNINWAMNMLEVIIDAGLPKDMMFKICCRTNEKMITKDFLDACYKANVWNIFLGCESGNQGMLDSMGKGTTVEENARAIAMIREAHINSQASFIVGLPGETRETVGDTVRFIQETKPTRVGVTAATPFPGTEFDRIVTEKGHKKDVPFEEYYYGNPIVRTEELSYEHITKYAEVLMRG